MAAAGDVCAGLLQHKATLLRELCDTNILDVLVKKGLFNLNDLELITGAVESDKCNYFIELVSKQSGIKLQELCTVLNKECPKLSKELMNDRHRYVINGYSTTHSAKENMVMNHNLNRRKQWLQLINRPDLDNPKTNPKCYFVCSLHFEKYMITSKPILKLDAEPVKFLPNQTTVFNEYEAHKDVATQTEYYFNSLSVFGDCAGYPDVPIVKQEIHDENIIIYQPMHEEKIEMTVPRLKLEFYVENDFKRKNSDEDPETTVPAKDVQTTVPAKKIRGKTKQPRKPRNIKPRNLFKGSENKKESSSSNI